MGNLIPFNFQGAPVRVVDLDGEPWFVGKDVAERLGYADPTNAMKQHCKGVVKRHPLQTAGGMQELRVLSEPDVLRLIVGSNLPSAEQFERWVFEEVLPTIRKTGSYSASLPLIDVRDPSQLSRIAIQLIEMNRELQDGAKRLQAEVTAMAPDVAAYKRIANTEGLLNLTEAAKVLGQQPKAFNRWLSVNRYVYRRPGGNLLAYQDRIQSGYLEHKMVLYQKSDGSDGSRDQVMVTRRGVSHFAKKLGVALPDDLFGHSVAAE